MFKSSDFWFLLLYHCILFTNYLLKLCHCDFKLTLLCYLNQFLQTMLFSYAFSSLFLIIDLYFFFPTVSALIINLTAELENPLGIPLKIAKAEIKTHAVTADLN